MVNAQDEILWSRRRLVVAVVGTLVLISPSLRNHDSFPLSTYPIYASARTREATFVTAHGEGADGSARRLSIGRDRSYRRPVDRRLACRGCGRRGPCR